MIEELTLKNSSDNSFKSRLRVKRRSYNTSYYVLFNL